jgi:uncharacterized SAM-binding protein YcdF (DUF218 family)
MTNLTTAVKDGPPQTGPLELTASPRQTTLGGLLVRQYRWGLSRWARFFLLVVLLTLGVIMFLNVDAFLAPTQRVDTDILVVEGWVHPYAIRASAAELQNHSYHHVFTTGGPVVGNGGYINDYQTAASVGADLLKKAGVPAEIIQMVPSHVMGRDRTYSSAIALREWLREHDMQVRSLNIVTEGAHARRTRLLFEKALGSNVAIGVIAVPSPDFDARQWWRYSEGVEEVVTEGVAYLYAKFFFLPSQSD